MPERELGVSDFGISAGGGPPEPAEGRVARDDARFDLAHQIRRITSAMVGLPIDDADITNATAALKDVADGLEERAGAGTPVACPTRSGR